MNPKREEVAKIICGDGHMIVSKPCEDCYKITDQILALFEKPTCSCPEPNRGMEHKLEKQCLFCGKPIAETCSCEKPLYPWIGNKPPADKLCGRCKKPIEKPPQEQPKSERIEELNVPLFMVDYFMYGKNTLDEITFIGQALQCLNDNIRICEAKINELVKAHNKGVR